MRVTYKPTGPISSAYNIIKIVIVISMFYQFGFVAGIMAILLIIDINDKNKNN